MTLALRCPSLYQINTRAWLRRLGANQGRPLTLDEVPDAALDAIAAHGFDWVWLTSVWRIGEASRALSRARRDWRAEWATLLPDFGEEDIDGSGFAIAEYRVAAALGGEEALAGLRRRLKARGLKLMLDFVPNHVALDHPWVESHPEHFVAGDEEALAARPRDFVRLPTAGGPRVFAHGRDPNFPGWTDTLQLNYANPALWRAQVDELAAIARRCDGARCDMAMLVEPEVFQRTWGLAMPPFWPEAIRAARRVDPDFTLLAEVYWDMEWTLQQRGFDYCYDKRLYDRLRAAVARPIRDHLTADPAYQGRLARFLENHDEPRAARVFPWPMHKAAAVVTYLAPGLRFFHEGQREGARVHLPTHLRRAPDEPVDAAIAAFYDRLLALLREHPTLRAGRWRQVDPLPAWSGNWSSEGFIAHAWEGADDRRYLAVVNYAPTQGQCHLRLPFPSLRGRSVRLVDLLGAGVHERDGAALLNPGLYVDRGPWGFHVFSLEQRD